MESQMYQKFRRGLFEISEQLCLGSRPIVRIKREPLSMYSEILNWRFDSTSPPFFNRLVYIISPTTLDVRIAMFMSVYVWCLKQMHEKWDMFTLTPVLYLKTRRDNLYASFVAESFINGGEGD